MADDAQRTGQIAGQMPGKPFDLPPQIRERTVAKARTLLEALPFMREHHGKVIVVKYGGAAMDTRRPGRLLRRGRRAAAERRDHGGRRARRVARR